MSAAGVTLRCFLRPCVCIIEIMFQKPMLSANADSSEEASLLPADVTDDSCRLESVPLVRDTDGPCTTDCGREDRSAQRSQDKSTAVKQEPQDVC